MRYGFGMRANSALYDRDFYAWTQEQARLLREGRLGDADIGNIAEEIESMGRGEKRELVSRLVVLFQHLLKWEYQKQRRGKSWWSSIAHARDELGDLLRDNPSFKSLLPDAVATAYPRARRYAAKETRMGLQRFPEACPWTVEQALDDGFWPGGEDA
jgi:hypothetical protein